MPDDNQNGMTRLMYHYAVDERLSLEEAKKKLHDNAYIRTTGEVLARYCGVGGSELQKKIIDILYSSSPFPAEKDSIRRKVNGWLNKKRTTIERDTLMQLTLGLKLTPDDAEEMLSLLGDETFHLRDPKDIVWLFALEHGMSYAEARGLLERIMRIYEENKSSEYNTDTMTETVSQQVAQIQTVEELESFIASQAHNLGKMHNTAYDIFMQLLELLKEGGNVPVSGGNEIEEGERITQNILKTYLHRDYVPTTKNRLANDIQRGIKKNWPSETNLSKMTHRDEDVTRKALILLFLACDGGETPYGNFAEEDYEDIFSDKYTRLSSMLADCGFSRIDPRNPFDWMVLYCLAKEATDETDDNIDDPLSENLRNFLSEIFSESE